MEQFSLIFAERLVWKLFKTWSYFRTVCLCNSFARKIWNLGALFKVIQNAIGGESALSQTPPRQSINLCKQLLQTPSGNSPRHKNVCVDSSVSEKASHKSLRSADGSGQKWSSWPEHRQFTSWRGTSGENSDSELVWESHYKNSLIETRKVTSSLYSCASRSNEHTWFDWRIYHLVINTTVPRQSGNSVRKPHDFEKCPFDTFTVG